jgi:hypothetical protein
MRNSTPNPMPSLQFPKWIFWLALGVIDLAIVFAVLNSFWYFEVINNDEMGVKIRSGQIVGIAQPAYVSLLIAQANASAIKASETTSSSSFRPAPSRT